MFQVLFLKSIHTTKSSNISLGMSEVNGKLEGYQKFSTDFLGGGFKYVLFLSLLGEDSQFE